MCLMSNAAHILTYSHNFFSKWLYHIWYRWKWIYHFLHLLLVTFSLWPCRPSKRRTCQPSVGGRKSCCQKARQSNKKVNLGTPQKVCRSSEWSHKIINRISMGLILFLSRVQWWKGRTKKNTRIVHTSIWSKEHAHMATYIHCTEPPQQEQICAPPKTHSSYTSDWNSKRQDLSIKQSTV